MSITGNPFDDATIIHSYQPDIIPNTRELSEGMPDNLEQNLRQFTGTDAYHVDSGLLLTDGAKWMLDVTKGYALLGFVRQYLQAIGTEEDSFVIIDWATSGEITIHDGRDPRNYLGAGAIPVAPPASVRLMTGQLGPFLVLLLASEY